MNSVHFPIISPLILASDTFITSLTSTAAISTAASSPSTAMTITPLPPPSATAAFNLTGPAISPPAGVIPSFDAANPSAQMLRGIASLCIILTTLFMLIRIHAKIIILRAFDPSDYIFTLGFITSLAYQAICLCAVADGAGKHQWDIRVKDLKPQLQGVYVARLFYGVPLGLTKTSIVLQYLKIFNPSGKKSGYMFWWCWATIVVMDGFYIALGIVDVFTATPIEYFWAPWIPGKLNIEVYTADFISGLLNTVIDAVIIFLPQKVIWGLRRRGGPSLTKASIVFGLSLLGLAASIVRTITTLNTMESEDKTYRFAIEGMWTNIEIAVTIVCSCLPCLTAFLEYVKPTTKPVFAARNTASQQSRCGGNGLER